MSKQILKITLQVLSTNAHQIQAKISHFLQQLTYYLNDSPRCWYSAVRTHFHLQLFLGCSEILLWMVTYNLCYESEFRFLKWTNFYKYQFHLNYHYSLHKQTGYPLKFLSIHILGQINSFMVLELLSIF